MYSQKNYRTRALLVSFLTRFSFIFSLQAIPPILPILIEEFSLTFTMASTLVWFVAVPGILISIIGGLLSWKYGVRPLLISGLLVCIFGSLTFSFSNSIFFMQISRLIIGVGGALAVVSSSTLLFQWFEKSKLGFAMGIFGFCMPAASAAAFNSLGFVANYYGWRFSIIITVVVYIIAFLACIILTKENREKIAPSFSSKPLKNNEIWILGLSWAFFNMAALVYTTWGKTIFIRYYDLSESLSDLLASMLMFGAFMQPLTGLISDKLGDRKRLIFYSCLSIFFIFLVFPYLPTNYFFPAAFILGLFVSFVPPAAFALAGRMVGSERGALGFGVMNTFLNLAIIFGPLGAGYILDVTDSNYHSFFFMAGLSLIASFLVMYPFNIFRNRKQLQKSH
ncbi:MFS transporter [Thermoproteota archaeon]